jgi:hypothetical protein
MDVKPGQQVFWRSPFGSEESTFTVKDVGCKWFTLDVSSSRSYRYSIETGRSDNHRGGRVFLSKEHADKVAADEAEHIIRMVLGEEP